MIIAGLTCCSEKRMGYYEACRDALVLGHRSALQGMLISVSPAGQLVPLAFILEEKTRGRAIHQVFLVVELLRERARNLDQENHDAFVFVVDFIKNRIDLVESQRGNRLAIRYIVEAEHSHIFHDVVTERYVSPGGIGERPRENNPATMFFVIIELLLLRHDDDFLVRGFLREGRK